MTPNHKMLTHSMKFFFFIMLIVVASLTNTVAAQTANHQLIYLPLVTYEAEPRKPQALPPTGAIPPETFTGEMFYVSRNGSNRDGRSWADAWNELDQIDWSVVNPGDLIWLDGGTIDMVYHTMMQVGKSGTASNPIHIYRAIDEGHNGRVVMFGGRTNDLPHCDQIDFVDQPVNTAAIQLRGHGHILIDGGNWSGITIHGFENGIMLDPDSTDVTLRNFEIYNNGLANYQNGKWSPSKRGILLSGTNMTFERMLIHDNGEDAIQSSSGDNNIANFTLRESWLYNTRMHPSLDESFNYCAHSDGIQIYAGGEVSGLTIQDSILGPGFTQNVVLGQGAKSTLSATRVNDVTFDNVILAKAAGINVYGTYAAAGDNWTFKNVTIDCAPNTKYTGSCIMINGAGHRIIDSIIMGSKNNFHIDDHSYNPFVEISNNCQYDNIQNGYGSQIQLGENWQPTFTDVRTDPLYLGDYAQLTDSPCAHVGATLTSAKQLLNIVP